MKRILGLILILFLLPINILAAEECNLLVSCEKNLDIVTVTVSISNNPGIATSNFYISFDNTKVTPQSITRGNTLLGTFNSNILQPGADLATLSKVTVLFLNNNNSYNNGVVCKIKFKIKEGSSGYNDFTLINGIDRYSIVNEDSEYIYPTVTNANIFLGHEVNLKLEDSKISGNAKIYREENKTGNLYITLAIYDSFNDLCFLMKRTMEQEENILNIDNINFIYAKGEFYTGKIFIWDRGVSPIDKSTKFVIAK